MLPVSTKLCSSRTNHRLVCRLRGLAFRKVECKVLTRRMQFWLLRVGVRLKGNINI